MTFPKSCEFSKSCDISMSCDFLLPILDEVVLQLSTGKETEGLSEFEMFRE